MRADDLEALIRCHRGWQGGTGHGKMARALREAQRDERLLSALVEQTAFDAECVQAIGEITPPADIRDRLRAAEPSCPSLRHFWRHPILVAGFAGFLLLAAVAGFLIYTKFRSFPGQAEAEEILSTTSKLSAQEMEPVGEGDAKAGALGDWFFLKYGLEQYSVPPEFAAIPALGCRVFRKDGKPVALVAMDDGRDSALLLIYKAADFKTSLPHDRRWRPVEGETWSGAARTEGANCFLVAMPGKPERLGAFLDRYPAKAR